MKIVRVPSTISSYFHSLHTSIYSIFIRLSYCYKAATISERDFSGEADSKCKILINPLWNAIFRWYENDFSENFFMNTNVLNTSVEPSFPQKNRPPPSRMRTQELTRNYEAICAALLPFSEYQQSGRSVRHPRRNLQV